MRIFINSFIFVACLLISAPQVKAEIQSEQAQASIESYDCKGQTINDVLKHTLKRHSQRDLGWRVFTEADYVDVERAILINKGQQIRYRWRIDNKNHIIPVSKRAKRLCE